MIGVHHETLGHEVEAFVAPRPDTAPSAEGLRAWVAETLAPSTVPACVELRTVVPYTRNGKVRKHELEAEEAAVRRG